MLNWVRNTGSDNFPVSAYFHLYQHKHRSQHEFIRLRYRKSWKFITYIGVVFSLMGLLSFLFLDEFLKNAVVLYFPALKFLKIRSLENSWRTLKDSWRVLKNSSGILHEPWGRGNRQLPEMLIYPSISVIRFYSIWAGWSSCDCDCGQADGGRVYGGRADEGREDGGEMDGGRADGGRVDREETRQTWLG